MLAIDVVAVAGYAEPCLSEIGPVDPFGLHEHVEVWVPFG